MFKKHTCPNQCRGVHMFGAYRFGPNPSSSYSAGGEEQSMAAEIYFQKVRYNPSLNKLFPDLTTLRNFADFCAGNRNSAQFKLEIPPGMELFAFKAALKELEGFANSEMYGVRFRIQKYGGQDVSYANPAVALTLCDAKGNPVSIDDAKSAVEDNAKKIRKDADILGIKPSGERPPFGKEVEGKKIPEEEIVEKEIEKQKEEKKTGKREAEKKDTKKTQDASQDSGEIAALEAKPTPAQLAAMQRLLKTDLEALSNFASFDNMDVLSTISEGIIRKYNKLSEYSDQEEALKSLMLEYRTKLPEYFRDAITDSGELAVNAKNASILSVKADRLTEAVRALNTFDSGLSDFVLRGTSQVQLEELKKAFAYVKGYYSVKDGEPAFDSPMGFLLMSRYSHSGLENAASILGITAQGATAADQYVKFMDALLGEDGKAIRRKAYDVWYSFAGRYPTEASPAANLASSTSTYSFRNLSSSQGATSQRKTFDFISQLVGANTMVEMGGMDVGSATLLLEAAKSMPAGTQVALFERKTFIDVVRQSFASTAAAGNSIATAKQEFGITLGGDMFGMMARYLGSIYYQQKNYTERYQTMSDIMGSIEKEMFSDKYRWDYTKNKVSDKGAREESGSLLLPGVITPYGFYWPWVAVGTDIGRLAHVSLFDGMNVPEVVKSMGLPGTNLWDNFMRNKYYADEYVSRLLDMRMMEIQSHNNYINFLPDYTSLLALIAEKYQNASRNLQDIAPKYSSGDARLFLGQGRRADGIGVDAQSFWQGVNPRQTLMFEGAYIPTSNESSEALGQTRMTNTELVGLKVWDLFGRWDQYRRSGAVQDITDSRELLFLDSTFGTHDGAFKVDFVGRQIMENGQNTQVYDAVAYLRNAGSWSRAIVNYDELDSATRDVLAHYFHEAELKGGFGWQAYGAMDNDRRTYPSNGYNFSGQGLMVAGTLPPIAGIMVAASKTVGGGKAAAADVRLAEKNFLTFAAYHFNDRDIFESTASGSVGGINAQYPWRPSYRRYAQYPKKSDWESDLASIDYFATDNFRAQLWGGPEYFRPEIPPSTAQAETRRTLAGGQFAKKNFDVTATTQWNQAGQLSRLRLGSQGTIPLESDASNYSGSRISFMGMTDAERDQSVSAAAGATLYGKERTYTLFGTTTAASPFISRDNKFDLVGGLESLRSNIDNADLTDRQTVSSLLYDLNNYGSRLIDPRLGGRFYTNTVYNMLIASSHTKRREGASLQNMDGFFGFSGYVTNNGPVNIYSLGVSYDNDVAVLAMHSPDIKSFGVKGRVGEKSVMGFTISKVPDDNVEASLDLVTNRLFDRTSMTLSGGSRNYFNVNFMGEQGMVTCIANVSSIDGMKAADIGVAIGPQNNLDFMTAAMFRLAMAYGWRELDVKGGKFREDLVRTTMEWQVSENARLAAVIELMLNKQKNFGFIGIEYKYGL